MPRFVIGTVTGLVSERPGLQRVEVDGEPAYVLSDLIGPVAVGDQVVVNTTAVDLGLGTGGWHFVHWNASRRSWQRSGGGRSMKLRYTSLQLDVAAAEESNPSHLATDLDGSPVVACDLHSQVACVALAFAHLRPGRRLVYVMTDSAALPLALSDLVFELRARGLVAATVTCGQAFGGDYEAVTVHSALQVARGLARADAVVVAPGPGVIGTGTTLGFGGVEVAAVCDAVNALGGRPIVAVRWSGADARPRHRGVSHHTITVLDLVHGPVTVPVARGVPIDLPQAVELDVPDLDWTGIASMGRRFEADPGFFLHAAAAGMAAAQALEPVPPPARPGQ